MIFILVYLKFVIPDNIVIFSYSYFHVPLLFKNSLSREHGDW